MEAFQKLLASHRSRKALETEDSASQEYLFSEGLSLVKDVLHNIEVHQHVKTSEGQGVDSLLCSLRNYITCETEPNRNSIPYCTARLATFTLEKIVQLYTASGEIDASGSIEMRYITQESKYLDSFIQILLQLKAVGRLKERSFIAAAAALKLPVKILNRLQKANLLRLSAYLCQHSGKPDVLKEFVDDLLVHFEGVHGTKEGSVPGAFEDAYELLGSLLQLGLGGEVIVPEPECLQKCSRVSQQILEMLVNQTAERVLVSNAPSGDHFLLLRERQRDLGPELVSSFLGMSLEALTSDPALPLEKALALQGFWLQVEPPPTFSAFLSKLLLAVGQAQAFSSIISLLDKNEANWQNVLFIVSAFLQSHEGAVDMIKGYIDSVVLRALAAQDPRLLGLGLLLARQASIGTTGTAFPSYSSWWGSTVGAAAGSNSTITSPTAFTFFMAFLTQLVPHEPPVCLRVQLNRAPSAPIGCAQLLADYIALAKTRLHDLGECTASGLFSLEATPQQDVDIALEQFERSGGQVSRVLLDTARFRKVHFEQFFLPALLVPELEGPSGQPTLRQGLIEKLRAANKIPKQALAAYDEGCRRLRVAASLKDSGGNSEVAGVTGPVEQWQMALDALIDAVRSTSSNDSMDVEEGSAAGPRKGTQAVLPAAAEAALANVSCQLKAALSWVHKQRDANLLQVNIVKRLLKAYMQSFKPPTTPVVSQSLVWPLRFLSAVEQYQTLYRSLHTALLKMGINPAMKPYMTEAMASLACGCDERNAQRCGNAAGAPSIGQAVGQALKPVNQQSMLHTLRFCSTYLQLLNESLGDSPPSPLRAPSLLRLLMYLRGRLLHCTQQEHLAACERAWFPPASWSQLVAQAVPTLEEWLQLESQVALEDDPVRPRHLYMCAWLHQHAIEDTPAPVLLAASLQASRMGAAEWSQELLALIPSLAPAVQPSVDAVAVPWLLSTWEFMSKQFSQSEIFRVMQVLPPWMLLVDWPSSTPSAQACRALAQLVMKHWKDNLSMRGFLSLSAVCLLLGAVSSCFPQNPGEALSKLIDECPALHVALLVHFEQLRSTLIPAFTQKTSNDCSLMRIVNVSTLTTQRTAEVSDEDLVWQRGLVLWARSGPRSGPQDYSVKGVLFFDLLEKGERLLRGTTSFVEEGDHLRLPEGIALGRALLEEPFHCMQMIQTAVDTAQQALPASGLSSHSLTGLYLITVAAMVSLPAALLPAPGCNTASMCIGLLKGCLSKWLQSVMEVEPCAPQLQEVSFLRRLTTCASNQLEVMGCGEGVQWEPLA